MFKSGPNARGGHNAAVGHEVDAAGQLRNRDNSVWHSNPGTERVGVSGVANQSAATTGTYI